MKSNIESTIRQIHAPKDKYRLYLVQHMYVNMDQSIRQCQRSNVLYFPVVHFEDLLFEKVPAHLLVIKLAGVLLGQAMHTAEAVSALALVSQQSCFLGTPVTPFPVFLLCFSLLYCQFLNFGLHYNRARLLRSQRLRRQDHTDFFLFAIFLFST